MTRIARGLLAVLRDARALADARDELVDECAWRDASIRDLIALTERLTAQVEADRVNLAALGVEADGHAAAIDRLTVSLRDGVPRAEAIRLAHRAEVAEAEAEQLREQLAERGKR